MIRRLLLASLGAFALLLGAQSAFAGKSSDEDEIRKLVALEVSAASARDIDKVMSVYWKSKDFVLYDAAVQEPFVGWDALKGIYEEYFKTFAGSMDGKVNDLQVGTAKDLGYAFSTQTWKFTKPDGTVTTAVQRVTNIYRKIDGRWQCIHEHASLPVNLLGSKSAESKKP